MTCSKFILQLKLSHSHKKVNFINKKKITLCYSLANPLVKFLNTVSGTQLSGEYFLTKP